MKSVVSSSRRTALKTLAAAALSPGIVRAADSPLATIEWADGPAFGGAPRVAQPIAKFFTPPAHDAAWPQGAALLGSDGLESLAHWRGKTLLVSLWAEWCAPCLAEMPALARLNRAYANQAFEILPIATGSHTFKTYADARDRLAKLKGADIATVLDASRDGSALMRSLAQMKLPPPENLPPGTTVTSTGLPCLLVVDPHGRLRGRFIGGPSAGFHPWDNAEGDAFIKWLASGALAT